MQDLYEGGQLEVPDDVTLLFGDDNFGTLRRLPGTEERKRKGGAGVSRETPRSEWWPSRLNMLQIYYHLEYVGWPRSYKWINSNSLVSNNMPDADLRAVNQFKRPG